jgi:glycosyltransferase involved in cell wall biosynthesis
VDEAWKLYGELDRAKTPCDVKALIQNDLGALAAHDGDLEAARDGFRAALALDGGCKTASANLALLEAEQAAPYTQSDDEDSTVERTSDRRPIRIAVLSFLFNWPSTGGGIVHTVELIQFLIKAGYEVKHFYASFPPWAVGAVNRPLPFPSERLAFEESSWNVAAIQDRYRSAVDDFQPDYVIITDSWNIKPLLAEAVSHFPYFLRFQAMECLCPLNNVRLISSGNGSFRQCALHQLARPEVCCECLMKYGRLSGDLHQAERALSGVGTREYYERLVRALERAEAVLVVNPLHEAMLSPYCRSVRVVTAGMSGERFPWPWPEKSNSAGATKNPRRQVFFAGMIEEYMKGFHLLEAACSTLWQRRNDFELVATGDPAGRVNEYTRFVGWLSQEALPDHLYAADLLVMPTIAQEALGRTAVEAMAAGRAVVASRIGGLPFTVVDGTTGLLFEPGNSDDLASRIEMLLDDSDLCKRLGEAGRRRFEEHYLWERIIDRHYRPLLKGRHKASQEAVLKA